MVLLFDGISVTMKKDQVQSFGNGIKPQTTLKENFKHTNNEACLHSSI